MNGLRGVRIVLLGASSGIGRSFGLHAIRGGAEVLLCGRRLGNLEGLASEAGGGTPLSVDVDDDSSIERLGETVATFGPVDAVLSTIGTAHLKRVQHTTQSDWASTMRTNVIGLNCAISTILPSLRDGALVVALSSEAADSPRWAMAAYGASKAALEVSFAGWRLEHPRLRFGTVVVGATMPTDFARAFDGEVLGTAMEVWTAHGQFQEKFMEADDVGQVLADLFAALLPVPGVNMERIVLRTPSPVLGHTGLDSPE
jgi:NADP-dependent 3-hydroxy acid dehydrogenase YdfG